MILRLAFIFISWWLVPVCCTGQALWGKTPAERNVLKHLRDIVSYIQYLRDVDENTLSPPEKGLLDSIDHKANEQLVKMPQYFQVAWKLRPPDGSDEYHKAIGNYDRILLWFDSVMLVKNSAADIHLFNSIADTLCKTLTFISDDMLLRFFASRTGRELVTVDVKVTDTAGLEQPGYTIFVKPYISSDPSLTTILSQPAKEISTGWKLFWIEKDDQCLQQSSWRVKADDPSTHHIVFVLKHE